MRILSNDELMRAPPATHFIRSWSGIIDPKDAAGITRNSVWAQLQRNETHEPQFRLFSGLPDESLVLDIGANCGQSIISFKSVAPGARLMSFEPTSFSFAIAERIARVFPQAEAFNFGLSDRAARLPIYTPVIDGLLVTPLTSLNPDAFEPEGTMHRFLMDDIAKGADVMLFMQEIELRRGDDLKLAPDVLKIDVEGAELLVLDGLEETIAAHRPMILSEKSDAAAIARFLATFGYEPYRCEGDEPGRERTVRPIAIRDGMDGNLIPLNVLYLCRDRLEQYRLDCGIEVRGDTAH